MSGDETGGDQQRVGSDGDQQRAGSDGDQQRVGSDGESAGREERGGPPVSLSPAGKSSVLWAAIGALAFLVLVQGFELWSGERVSVLVKFAVAAVVAVVAGGATYVLQGRVPAANESA